ncbi:uncharacterized protein LOC125220907 [Salvia hispanica]|uniref:uncharacterized protein LOC125220907 n=1 Tax=Salvia hispanica TaxID=49212 RepID=UPI0020097D00|nr:uncharacterized protein LOC125220907 [Salvia hispanica]
MSLVEGKPSIYFSGEDTQFLAERMGHTIIGKFSHSIPSSHQIQKCLSNMKFIGGFSWKYINAKHVAIQVEDATDYAKLLVGQNGMPVWYVDRHPMRVFRWSPEFNPYFETPIAAVWCNLVGLPIHLFEKSALFTIGGMLGNPIQVDHATASQTRLSFVRICVEIDISNPPTEEFIIDIMGREVVQKVIWDKIPLFCRECHYVGRSSSACYANGQRERPMKRNYHTPRHNNSAETQQQSRYQPVAGENDSGKIATHQKVQTEVPNQDHHEASASNERQHWSNDRGKEHNKPSHGAERQREVDEDGFQIQRRRRGPKQSHPKIHNSGLPRTNSTGDIGHQQFAAKPQDNQAGVLHLSDPQKSNQKQEMTPYWGRLDEAWKTFVKPSYYK